MDLDLVLVAETLNLADGFVTVALGIRGGIHVPVVDTEGREYWDGARLVGAQTVLETLIRLGAIHVPRIETGGGHGFRLQGRM